MYNYFYKGGIQVSSSCLLSQNIMGARVVILQENTEYLINESSDVRAASPPKVEEIFKAVVIRKHKIKTKINV